MIRAVVWKEFREQWLIGLTLVVLGGGLLVAAATLGDPPSPVAAPTDVINFLGVGRLTTLMLVVTAGTVCGGALFAAEREAGTMTFLDVLPGARWQLWRAKIVAGAVLGFVQTVVILGLATALQLATVEFAARLVLYGLLAFVWGALGSTLARTTLGSVGIAVPAALLTTFVYLVPICLIFAPPGSSLPRPVGWVLFEVLMLLTPLALSGRWFTATDRARKIGPGRPPSHARALLWLGLRQMRVTGAVLSVFALAFGFALLLPESRPVFVWPPLALVAGVLAGVTAFGDEQTHRIAPFWAEGRLPIGRAWVAKVGVHLVLVGWLLTLLLLPSAVRAQLEVQGRFSSGRSTFAAMFHDRMFDELGPQTWKYLLIPAVYGFVAGHLCGLLFRKLVVGCGVALMVGGALSALWGPSLLAGGLSHWQAWLPAGVLLVAGRFSVRAWASERLTQYGPLLRLAAGVSAALLAFAVGIGYRVLEVPDNPNGEDDIAFVNTLPSYDENVAGREFRAATERYTRVALVTDQEPDGRTAARLRPRIEERMDLALRQGWAPTETELGPWLDRLFAEANVPPGEKPWHAMAAVAAEKPIGLFEAPQLVGTAATTATSLENARRMAVALLVRGLQDQAAGAHDSFLPKFGTVMALARNVQNGSGVLARAVGMEIERLALSAAERWLERYPGPNWVDRSGGRAELLRDAIHEVERFETGDPIDLRLHYLADRYVLRELLRVPGPWLAVNLTPAGGTPEQVSAEADLVSFAWAVPWERERTRRLLGLGYEQAPTGTPSERTALVSGRPGATLLLTRNRAFGDLVEADRYLCVVRRALALRLAVRAHVAEKGSAPAGLAELATGADPYLKAVPADPYTEGQPFGYRVSAGETLRGPPRPTAGPGTRATDAIPIAIRPGQVLVWSVGIDRVDQGALVAPNGGGRAEDLVFLVPMFPPALK